MNATPSPGTPSPLRDPWRNALLMELRMRDVPGQRIGEILAEVDTHCADSGEDAREAFGDPVAYARSFDGVPARTPAGNAVKTAAQALATVAGVISVLSGIAGLAHDVPGDVTVGGLVSLAAVTVVAGVIGYLRRAGRILMALAVAGFAAAMLPPVIWTDVAVRLPGWALVAGGLAALAAAWWPTLAGRLLPDPVIDPRTGATTVPTPRYLLPLVFWSLPAVLLAAALVAALA